MARPADRTIEGKRLAEVPSGRAPWRHWGPYLAERGWGTVREDYTATGDAWNAFPFDQARSRAYRWDEDGLAGICDDRQTLCLAFAFWNGVDPFLKERIFGLSGPQGNHGEDAKEYWWFLDSTPTHSWMRWRYMYSQHRFPYEDLVAENARRGKDDPEYELVDTGIFDDSRHFDITIDYAKASPEDICIRLTAENCGPDAATLHVLPTLWFRNTWSWGADRRTPEIRADQGGLLATHRTLSARRLVGDGSSTPLLCDNESNTRRLWNTEAATAYPKDGINDHVVNGAATVNPAQTGTKGALWYALTVAPGERAEIRLRLGDVASPDDLGAGFAHVMSARQQEGDEFYAALTRDGATEDEQRVMRQAFAGMLWSKQFYHYDVDRWLEGDPAFPPPPAARLSGRNSEWRHLNNLDVISMPDTWEYPWYAAWDLAFHCVALAHVDPGFAKNQLILLGREWYMHPNGQLPAYEWNFGDVNPPVHAWATKQVFEIAGDRDYAFLERVFHKLLLNFTWWVNRKDREGQNIFEGGFLGLDNIGPFDRSMPLTRGHLEQSDGTAWMAMFCLSMLELSFLLADNDHVYEDIATKFFEHYTLIAVAMNERGLWNDEDGFYYDLIRSDDGGPDIPLAVRSMVGLVPLFAVCVLEPATLGHLGDFAERLEWYLHNKPVDSAIDHKHVRGPHDRQLLSIVRPERLRRILTRVLDESEFLSPHGLRALSRAHRDRPFVLDLPDGGQARVDYEPAESRSGLFGGNSNWRGPVWFPVNFLVIEGLRRFHRYLGDGFTVECPTGSGRQATLDQVADELSRRLVSLFLEDGDARRPVFGDCELFQRDPRWHDLLPFHEYFHGDTGKGLGASHQTGWTGLVASLLAHPSVGGTGSRPRRGRAAGKPAR
jgi:hypothetical protein